MPTDGEYLRRRLDDILAMEDETDLLLGIIDDKLKAISLEIFITDSNNPHSEVARLILRDVRNKIDEGRAMLPRFRQEITEWGLQV